MSDLTERIVELLHRHRPNYDEFVCACGFLVRGDCGMTPDNYHRWHVAECLISEARTVFDQASDLSDHLPEAHP